MTRTYGEYEITLDGKGRIALPASFKRQLPEAESKIFMLSKGNGNFLVLYTLSQWKKVEETIDSLNDYNEEAMELKLTMMSGASPIELDAAGRIIIPKRMLAFAGFKQEDKDVILLGMSDKTLIWNLGEYEIASKIDKERQKALSSKILGATFLNPTKVNQANHE